MVKTIMRWTGASERSAKNWFSGNLAQAAIFNETLRKFRSGSETGTRIVGGTGHDAGIPQQFDPAGACDASE